MSYILKNYITVIAAVILFVITPQSAFSQQKYAKEYEKSGDQAMNEGEYHQALEYYTLGRKFVKQNLNLMYKCGEACMMLKNYDKAEYWYQKVLIENDSVNINNTFPYLYLHLAQAAICNGNIIQAQSFLNTCLLDCNDIEIRKQCKAELSRIDWIIDNDTPGNYKITNLGKNVNNEASQSNTFIIRDSVMIFTDSDYKTVEIKGQTFYKDVYQQLYFSFIDEDYYTPRQKLAWGNINKKKTDVADLFLDTVTYTAYFTYSKTHNGKKISSIYYSVFNNKTNKWEKPKIFKPLEDNEHSYSHPVVAYKGGETVMYFASDREGGFGNMDIWYIDMYKENAVPVNLGSTVNTTGNEITPFYYSQNNELYFSSDTHFGFGGFDIFKSSGWKTSWQKAENMLMPINSPANDMYFYLTDCDCKGYFTSNRISDNNKENKTCCNDIYRFNYVAPIPVLAEPVTPQVKDTFNINDILPVSLYFHNDSPDAGSDLPTTDLSYSDCYKLYMSQKNIYKANRTKGMEDSLADIQLKDIDNFFNDKIEKGYKQLNIALDYITKLLLEGHSVTVQIKGYCSSLYQTEYNRLLAQRRINSTENYMRTYNGGILSAYMDNIAKDGKHVLETEHLAVGKAESNSPNPENLEEKRMSIYLPSAMEERRIEIQVIKCRD